MFLLISFCSLFVKSQAYEVSAFVMNNCSVFNGMFFCNSKLIKINSKFNLKC